MESPQNRLFEAAANGCVISLRQLLSDHPSILDRVMVNYYSDTPLHVAAMLGHIDFVLEIVQIKPELTNERNSQRSSPLHLASARGHVDVVIALLSVGSRTCLSRDSNGLTPLHLAAIEGRDEVMRLLLEAQPDAARLMVYRHETILHLCVKHYQLEALKLLLASVPEFVNYKDGDGNTALHLAVGDQQVEITKLLLDEAAELEVNELNHEGMTAMDVLIQSRREVRDSEVAESLKHAGGTPARDLPPAFSTKDKKKNHDWFDKKKNVLMLVATLNATMAFQIGVNPPGGVWQDDNVSIDSHGHMVGNPTSQTVNSANSNVSSPPHQAGCPILERNAPSVYMFFYISNSIGFVSSLAIIFLLMSGFHSKSRFFVWILTVISHVAILATVSTYFSAVIGLTGLGSRESGIENVAVSVWCGLMALVIIFQAVRLFMKLSRRPPQV